jgi:hypothetical protein
MAHSGAAQNHAPIIDSVATSAGIRRSGADEGLRLSNRQKKRGEGGFPPSGRRLLGRREIDYDKSIMAGLRVDNR